MKSHSLHVIAFTCAVVAATTATFAQAAAPGEIVIPGSRVFPESITSTRNGTVIIGSVGARTIFRAQPGSAAAEAWIQPGTDGMQGVFGVLADERSKTLWACSGSFGAPPDGSAPPPSTLHAFDLETGAPKGKYPMPMPRAFCNDIAVAPDGTAYATDTSNMLVVRLKRGGKSLEVWAGNGSFGPTGGILDGIAVVGRRVLVNALGTSKLFSAPIQSNGGAGEITEVKLDRALEQPDGMRSFGKSGLLVVEGGGGGRLSKITLSGDSGKVTTVKEGYPDGPVAVTVVDTTAYVLEGQLGAMRGPQAADAPAKPFHATAVEVGKP